MQDLVATPVLQDVVSRPSGLLIFYLRPWPSMVKLMALCSSGYVFLSNYLSLSCQTFSAHNRYLTGDFNITSYTPRSLVIFLILPFSYWPLCLIIFTTCPCETSWACIAPKVVCMNHLFLLGRSLANTICDVGHYFLYRVRSLPWHL